MYKVTHMYLVKIYFQFLDTAHIILILNTQSHSLCISSRTIKLKGSWISVNVLEQKFCSILSQQPALYSDLDAIY